jgi:hypothetical protein
LKVFRDPGQPTPTCPGPADPLPVLCSACSAALYQSRLAVLSVACLLPHALAKDLLAWARRSTIIQKSIQPMNTRAPSFAPVMLSQPSRATSVPLCPSCSKKTHSSTRSTVDRSEIEKAPEKKGSAAIRPAPPPPPVDWADLSRPNDSRVGSLASRGLWPANGCSPVQRIARPCRQHEVETDAQGMGCSSSCHWLIRYVSTFQVQQGRMTAIIIHRLPTLSGAAPAADGPMPML